jgi:rod shape-determining protein MreD
MIIEILNFVVRFILLVFLQIVIVNNIDLSAYVNPYIYVVLILSLPYNTKPWLILVISFLLGITMDTFSSMPGPHIAATVFMGYLRRFYLIFSTNKDDLTTTVAPNFNSKGPIGYMVYVLIMVFSHHFLLFFLEAFSFSHFFSTLSRIFFSTLFTVLLIGIGQLLFYKVAKKAQ